MAYLYMGVDSIGGTRAWRSNTEDTGAGETCNVTHTPPFTSLGMIASQPPKTISKLEIVTSKNRQLSETLDPINTTTTTSTNAWTATIPAQRSGVLIVQAEVDNGTSADEAVYKCTYRRGAGSLAIIRAALDQSSTGFANGYVLEFAAVGNVLTVRVKAPNVTAAKWSLAVGLNEQNITP